MRNLKSRSSGDGWNVLSGVICSTWWLFLAGSGNPLSLVCFSNTHTPCYLSTRFVQFHQSDKIISSCETPLAAGICKGWETTDEQIGQHLEQSRGDSQNSCFYVHCQGGSFVLSGIIFHIVKGKYLEVEMTSLACTRS